jgi:GTP-binding protein EngB required for normal cell division
MRTVAVLTSDDNITCETHEYLKWSLNMKLGIVGLPNVGKSTLFNAITMPARIGQLSFLHHRTEFRVSLRYLTHVWIPGA